MTTATETTPSTAAARYTAVTFTDLFLNAALSAAGLGITPVSMAVIRPDATDDLPAVAVRLDTVADVNALADHYAIPAEHTQAAAGFYTRSAATTLAGTHARVTLFAPHPHAAPVVA